VPCRERRKAVKINFLGKNADRRRCMEEMLSANTGGGNSKAVSREDWKKISIGEKGGKASIKKDKKRRPPI